MALSHPRRCGRDGCVSLGHAAANIQIRNILIWPFCGAPVLAGGFLRCPEPVPAGLAHTANAGRLGWGCPHAVLIRHVGTILRCRLVGAALGIGINIFCCAADGRGLWPVARASVCTVWAVSSPHAAHIGRDGFPRVLCPLH